MSQLDLHRLCFGFLRCLSSWHVVRLFPWGIAGGPAKKPSPSAGREVNGRKRTYPTLGLARRLAGSYMRSQSLTHPVPPRQIPIESSGTCNPQEYNPAKQVLYETSTGTGSFARATN